MDVLSLKKANCKNCHKCIRACPVKSIRFVDNQAKIITQECILCGRCVVTCPQNAKRVPQRPDRGDGGDWQRKTGHRKRRAIVYCPFSGSGDRRI